MPVGRHIRRSIGIAFIRLVLPGILGAVLLFLSRRYDAPIALIDSAPFPSTFYLRRDRCRLPGVVFIPSPSSGNSTRCQTTRINFVSWSLISSIPIHSELVTHGARNAIERESSPNERVCFLQNYYTRNESRPRCTIKVRQESMRAER